MDKEKLKYEIAEELGLLDKVLEDGWKALSDTHPDCTESIKLFNSIVDKRKVMFYTYQSLYGPLVAETYSGSESTWDWIDDPWPWSK